MTLFSFDTFEIVFGIRMPSFENLFSKSFQFYGCFLYFVLMVIVDGGTKTKNNIFQTDSIVV